MEIDSKLTQLSGLFRTNFLEYSSYVILERAVPNIDDGLKPVQRRILHAMQTIDDGRFNKAANIVGTTMQYHPHGDSSIGDALVQLGQKELLIETQGNWGNIITGDSAAAPRYIEAMLSEFAMETVFSPKITEWVPSYDGRKREPVTLPVKFPLLLAQGVEGIAVGLSSKILPHNFNEIADAAADYLEGKEFKLFPDFQTGGLLDASRYNDGARGGRVKVRAKIEKVDSKTLAITELPFGKTTSGMIASIIEANDKGKIKIRKVDDNTSATAEILVHLTPGTSPDKAIDALYTFTDCEISISPNCCVINDKKPEFLTVSDLLRHSADRTRDLLKKELLIKLSETREEIFFNTLEKIFIEERMYKDREIEEAENMEAALAHLDKRLEPFKPQLYREVTDDDLRALWEIKMGRILKFNSDKALQKIEALSETEKELLGDIDNIQEYTAQWFRHLKEKYGANFPRRTTLRNFGSIEAAKVAEANKRLYYDKEGGFLGTSLKDSEFQFLCSDLDEILLIYDNGSYKIVKTPDKLYVGENVLHIGLFKKGDKRTVYNVVYRNGKPDEKDDAGKPLGAYYKKRFHITGLNRDKEYNLTKGYPGSEVIYLSVNPDGEAETISIKRKDKAGKSVEVNFADLEIKGKDSLGNLVTKYPLSTTKNSIKVLSKGISTASDRELWFERAVMRLNYEGRGDSLGFFGADDKVLAMTNDFQYKIFSNSESNHFNEFDDKLKFIEKFNPNKVWTLIFREDGKKTPSMARFMIEASDKLRPLIKSDRQIEYIDLTDDVNPVYSITPGGKDAHRQPEEIDAEEFTPVRKTAPKSGRLVSKYEVEDIIQVSCKIPDKTAEETSVDPTENNPEPEEPMTEATGTGTAPENEVTGNEPSHEGQNSGSSKNFAPSLFDDEEDI